MKCYEVQAQLTAYLDDEVTPSERALLDSHLAGCETCRRDFTALQAARGRLKSYLNARAGQAAPAARTWQALRSNAEEDARASSWLKRARSFLKGTPDGRGTHPTITNKGTFSMNRKALTALAGLAAVAVVALVLARNTTTVSAQQVLEYATAARASAETDSGIWHVVIEDYQNPAALDGREEGTTTVVESYDLIGSPDSGASQAAPAGGRFRTITRDDAGALLEAVSSDGEYTYSTWPPDGQPPEHPVTIYRSPLTSVERGKAARTAGSDGDPTQSVFEQFRANPRVRLEGKVTREDGREAYVLIGDNYQNGPADGQSEKTLTGTMTMVFDAQTYRLLESTQTVRSGGKDFVLNRYRWTVSEVLPFDAPVAWDLSDLPGMAVVDQPAQEEAQGDVQWENLTVVELTARVHTYLLDPLPDGFTREIVTYSGQEINAEYRYEIHYTGPAGETFNMQAVGVMDPAFVQSSFYDGSYKAASGLVLSYSPSSSETSISAMLVTPEGQGFLVDSNQPRAWVEHMVDQLVLRK